MELIHGIQRCDVARYVKLSMQYGSNRPLGEIYVANDISRAMSSLHVAENLTLTLPQAQVRQRHLLVAHRTGINK